MAEPRFGVKFFLPEEVAAMAVLYVKERKPLREVAAIMRNEFDVPCSWSGVRKVLVKHGVTMRCKVDENRRRALERSEVNSQSVHRPSP